MRYQRAISDVLRAACECLACEEMDPVPHDPNGAYGRLMEVTRKLRDARRDTEAERLFVVIRVPGGFGE